STGAYSGRACGLGATVRNPSCTSARAIASDSSSVRAPSSTPWSRWQWRSQYSGVMPPAAPIPLLPRAGDQRHLAVVLLRRPHRDPVLLPEPLPEVHQLAALGAER